MISCNARLILLPSTVAIAVTLPEDSVAEGYTKNDLINSSSLLARLKSIEDGSQRHPCGNSNDSLPVIGFSTADRSCTASSLGCELLKITTCFSGLVKT